MPTVARSALWFIRITLSHQILKEKCPTVLGWVDLKRVLFIGHVGNKTEKEHGHMLLELSTTLQKQSLDVRLKSLFGVKGADYSSKPWDGADSAGAYMYHDTNYNTMASKGFTPDDIQKFITLNDATQKVIAVNKEKGTNKNVDAVLAIFLGEAPTRREIGLEFIRRIRNGDMYDPGDWKLKSLIEEVVMRLCRTEAEFETYASLRLDNILSR